MKTNLPPYLTTNERIDALNGRSYILTSKSSGSAGTYNLLQLYNPSDSSVRAYINGLQIVYTTSTTTAYIGRHDSQLATLDANRYLECKSGTTHHLESRHEDFGSLTIPTHSFIVRLLTNQQVSLVLDVPIILEPGEGLAAGPSSASVEFGLAFFVTEEDI